MYDSAERLAKTSWGTFKGPFNDNMWSAGLTFVECVRGYYWIPGRGFTGKLIAIMELGFEAFKLPATSEDCEDFLMQCRSRAERPQAKGLLRHEFLSSGAYAIATLAAFLAGLPNPFGSLSCRTSKLLMCRA